MASSKPDPARERALGGVYAFAAYFLWGAASHAFGAVQDVVADREAGIGSVATVIGARATVRLSIVPRVWRNVSGVIVNWRW